ncbi:hypothetical protein Tco_0663935 [Tanacetum coccineum]
MTSNSKVGLGYEIQSNKEVLSYEEEMNRTVFQCTEKDFLNKPLYSRFSKTDNFKGVPHPLTDDNSTEHSTCQSNDSEGSFGNPSKHSSESESESVSVPNEMYASKSVITNEKVVFESKEVKPSCATHVKTPRQQMKIQGTSEVKGTLNNMIGKENREDLGQPSLPGTSNSFSPKDPQVKSILIKEKKIFLQSHFTVRRPIVRNIAIMTYSHAIKGNWGTTVKISTGYNWRRPRPNSNYNSGSNLVRVVNVKGPQGSSTQEHGGQRTSTE